MPMMAVDVGDLLTKCKEALIIGLAIRLNKEVNKMVDETISHLKMIEQFENPPE